MEVSRQAEAVLAAFLKDPSVPMYGLEVSRGSGLASGTIYPMLARFEKAGWLSSEWESIDPAIAGRPPRRLYCLTAEGEKAARLHFEMSLVRLGGVLRPGWSPA